jgi:hypothetical protein
MTKLIKKFIVVALMGIISSVAANANTINGAHAYILSNGNVTITCSDATIDADDSNPVYQVYRVENGAETRIYVSSTTETKFSYTDTYATAAKCTYRIELITFNVLSGASPATVTVTPEAVTSITAGKVKNLAAAAKCDANGLYLIKNEVTCDAPTELAGNTSLITGYNVYRTANGSKVKIASNVAPTTAGGLAYEDNRFICERTKTYEVNYQYAVECVYKPFAAATTTVTNEQDTVDFKYDLLSTVTTTPFAKYNASKGLNIFLGHKFVWNSGLSPELFEGTNPRYVISAEAEAENGSTDIKATYPNTYTTDVSFVGLSNNTMVSITYTLKPTSSAKGDDNIVYASVVIINSQYQVPAINPLTVTKKAYNPKYPGSYSANIQWNAPSDMPCFYNAEYADVTVNTTPAASDFKTVTDADDNNATAFTDTKFYSVVDGCSKLKEHPLVTLRYNVYANYQIVSGVVKNTSDITDADYADYKLNSNETKSDAATIDVEYTTDTPTGVENINSSNVKVTSANEVININGSFNGNVNVYNIGGQQVYCGTESEIAVPAGMYIVKVDGAVHKVLVK